MHAEGEEAEEEKGECKHEVKRGAASRKPPPDFCLRLSP
jgi:hypothetical protein